VGTSIVSHIFCSHISAVYCNLSFLKVSLFGIQMSALSSLLFFQ
jgi:hypothetical protein